MSKARSSRTLRPIPYLLSGQELLGEALVEVQHHRELQSINSKNLALLKDQAECAAAQADFVYKDLTQSNSQVP